MGFVQLTYYRNPSSTLVWFVKLFFKKMAVAFLYVHTFSVLLCLCSFRLALLFNALAYEHF